MQALRRLNSPSQLGSKLQLTSELQEASKAAAELQVHMQNAVDPKTGQFDLVNFRQSLQTSGHDVQYYANQLKSMGNDGQMAFLKVGEAIAAAEIPMRRSNQLLDSLWTTMKNTMRWQLTTSMLRGFLGSIQTAYGYTQDLNESLNNIRIVTQKSTDDMASFARQANEAAKALSTTTTNYTDASLIYYQQGLSDADVAARTDTTIKLANVTRQSAETVSEQMTAIWNNFDDGSESIEHYADVITALGATTASSSEEIAQGVQKFAAVADSVGLSYEYATTALATLVAETRQSPDIIGTSLRTLFARVQGLNQDEEQEDGTTLNKYSQALANVGISITDTSGKLKEMDTLLAEMATRWETLSDKQRLALAQTVGGVRQYTTLVALMENWDKFQTNLTTAMTSEGALQEQADIYAESWEAARDRVRAAAEDIYDSLFNEETFIAIDNSMASILSFIADITDGMGGLKGVLSLVSTLMFQIYGERMAESIRNMAVSIGFETGKQQEQLRALKQEWLEIADKMSMNPASAGTRGEANSYSIMKEMVKLQLEFNDKSADMTQEEIRRYNVQKQTLDVLRQSTDELNKQVAAQRKAVTEAFENIQSSRRVAGNQIPTLSGNTKSGLKLKGAAGEYTEDFVKNFTDLMTGRSGNKSYTNYFNDFFSKGMQNAFEQVRTSIEQLSQQKDGLSVLRQEIQNTTDLSPEVLELAHSLGYTDDELEEMAANKDAQVFTNRIDEIEKKLATLKQALIVLFGATPEEAESLIRKLQGLTTGEEQATQASERFKNGLDGVRQSMNDVGQSSNDYAAQIVKVGQTLSSTGMFLSSFSSTLDTISDDSISFSDRLVRVTTSLGMMAPTIAQVVGKLQEMEILGSLSGILGMTGQAVVGFVSAIGSAIVAAGPWLAVIGALIIAVNKFGPSVEKSTEAIKKANEAYNSAASELEFLNDQLEQTANRIDEINSKDTIELVDKNELEKLKQQEGYLQRQITLQEKTVAIARQKQLDKIKANYSQKYTELNDAEANSFDILDEKDYHGVGTYEEYIDKQISGRNAWVQEHMDQLSAFEEEYNAVIEGVREGATFGEQALADMQEELRNARLNMFSEGEYAQIYIEPVLDSEAGEKIKDQLYSAILHGDNTSNLITQDLQQELQAYGISFEEFIKFVKDRMNEAATVMVKRLDVPREELNKLTAEDWDIITTLSFSDIKTADDLWQALDEHKNNQVNVNVKFSGDYDKVHEIIDTLEYGSIISKEDYQALGEEVQGYFQELISGEYQFVGEQSLLYETERQRLLSSLREDYNNYIDQTGRLRQFTDNLLKPQGSGTGAIENLNAVNTQLDVLEAMGAAEDKIARWREIVSNGIVTKDDVGIYQEIADELNNLQVTADGVFNTMGQLGQQAYDTAIKIASESQSIGELETAQKELNLAQKDYQAILETVTDKEAERYDIDPDDIRDLADEYLNEADAIVETQAEARELAVQNIRMNKGFEDLVDSWKDWSNVIKKVNLKQLSKTSLDYVDTIQELTSVISDLVGASKDLELSEEFFDSAENIKLLEKAAQGSEKAVDQLGVKVAMDMVDTTVAATDVTNSLIELNQALDSGAITNDRFSQEANSLLMLDQNAQIVKAGFQDLFNTLEVGGIEAVNAAIQSGELLGADWQEAMNEMAYATNMTVDQMKAMFSSAGMTADVTTITKDVTQKVPVYETIEDVETLNDGSDGTPARYRKVTHTSQIDTVEVPGSIEVAQINVGDENAGKLPTVRPPVRYTGNGSGGITPSRKSAAGSGGGSKGSSAKPKVEDKLERKTPKDIDDRYHEINRTIQEQDELLQDIDEDIDLAYGTDRLKLFEKQLEALNKQADNYRGKMDLASHFKDIDKQNLKDVVGLTDEDFDPVTGEVLKYQDVLDGILKDYNTFGDKYDAFIDKYNNMTPEQQEAAQEQLDALKKEQELEEENFDQKLEALKMYEDSLDEWQEAQNQFEEKMREIESVKLRQITYKMDVILEIKNAKDEIRDFTKQVAESLSDDLYHQLIGPNGINGGSIELSADQAEEDFEMLKYYENEYLELQQRLFDANQYTNMDELKDAFLELSSNIIGTGQDLLNWIETLETLLPNAIDAARERFDQFTNQLEHNQTMLDTIEELYTLQGETYKTQRGFERLQRVGQERVDASVANAVLNRQWAERAKKDLDIAQKQLDDLMASYADQVTEDNPMPWESDVMFDTLKANRDALLDEFNEAQEAMYESAAEAMQAAQDMYLQQVDKAVYDFGQALTDGQGLDLLQDKYDHYIEAEGRYFDKVNEAYNVAAWYNKLQQAIDDSENSTLTNNLKALQEEIDLRHEGGTLSEYDLEILEAKYKVLEAQAALEDAQNNKNELRLTRDRQGNWNFQYNANPDEIADKQQQLLDAENEWYNIAKQQVQDVTGEIVDTWNECSEQIKDLYTDMNLTDQQRADKALEIYQYYAEKVKFLENEKQIAIQDMTEAGNKSLFDMAVVAGDEVADLTGITADEIQQIVDDSGQSLLELLLSNNEQIKDIVGSNSKLIDDFDNVFARDLANMTKNAANFESELSKTMDNVSDKFNNYNNVVDKVADETGTNLYELDLKTQGLSDSTDTCRRNGEELTLQLWAMIDATSELISKYEELARAIMNAMPDMQNLASQSVASAEATQDRAKLDYWDSLDYSTLQAEALRRGNEADYDFLQGIREGKIERNPDWTEEYYKAKGEEERARAQQMADSGNYSKKTWGDLTYEEILEELRRRGFATGGYTGEFEGGRIALLHEKELVLNQEDTENILSAVQTIRDLGPDFWSGIGNRLDNAAGAGMVLMGERLRASGLSAPAGQLEQNVHIEAVFPYATDRNEIEAALLSLNDRAAQYIRRRRD